jgi:hypothetical protein
MIAIVYVGPHEVRLAPQSLFYVRFQGKLTVEDAQTVRQLACQHTAGRDALLLVDVLALGHLDRESRIALGAVDDQATSDCGHRCDIVFLHARLLQKVVLAQIVSMAALYSQARLGIYFFDSLDDALDWLDLPPSTLLG